MWYKERVEGYLKKHGIKLNFLIPKNEIMSIKEIGKGGFGQVYLGRWLGQEVAIKVPIFVSRNTSRKRGSGTGTSATSSSKSS